MFCSVPVECFSQRFLHSTEDYPTTKTEHNYYIWYWCRPASMDDSWLLLVIMEDELSVKTHQINLFLWSKDSVMIWKRRVELRCGEKQEEKFQNITIIFDDLMIKTLWSHKCELNLLLFWVSGSDPVWPVGSKLDSVGSCWILCDQVGSCWTVLDPVGAVCTVEAIIQLLVALLL